MKFLNKLLEVIMIILFIILASEIFCHASYINSVENKSYYSQKEKHRCFKVNGNLVCQENKKLTKTKNKTEGEIVSDFFNKLISSIENLNKKDDVIIKTYWEEN